MEMIFFRFSTELSPSTTTEKLPPVVVVTLSVIGVTAAEEPVPHPSDGTAGDGADEDGDDDDGFEVLDDGPPSHDSPPPLPPDFSIVQLRPLLRYNAHQHTHTHKHRHSL